MALAIGTRLRAALTENINLKLLSFGFALVLYSLVHGSQDAQRSVSVSFVLLLPPETANRVLVTQLPPSVRVTLRGPRTVLDDLRAEDLGNIQVDVHTGTEKRVLIEAAMVHVPAGVRVEQIDPPVVDLQWEDRVVRDVPVQVGVIGTPAPGFSVLGTVIAEPATVRARGPQSDVQLLQYVRADPFDVQGLTEGKYPRTVGLDRPHARSVALDAASVLATATIVRELGKQTFKSVQVQVLGQTRGKAVPASVDVEVHCPAEVLRAIRTEALVVTVEAPPTPATGIALGTVKVVVPDHACTSATAMPPQLTVRW